MSEQRKSTGRNDRPKLKSERLNDPHDASNIGPPWPGAKRDGRNRKAVWVHWGTGGSLIDPYSYDSLLDLFDLVTDPRSNLARSSVMIVDPDGVESATVIVMWGDQ